ncbi:hypothetical protein LIER_13628 [Lithospermum erythrorhizon]|uniref:Uncharacterized protein n=1 Tax=Lithospermum erythrorhizon TaxID=34254 RepID=A0AAV3PW81_LITER
MQVHLRQEFNPPQTGGYSEDMIPTVGFNMRKVAKGNVIIKLWDIGGQRRFRTMWERYCRGVSAILYVVDAADKIIDKSEALSKQAMVDHLGLDSIEDREVCCYMISCKESLNIDVVIHWLIKHSKTAK